MKILDRYVLSNFLTNYLICFLVLIGLYVVVDSKERFEDIRDFSALAQSSESPLVQLGRYYLYNVPLIFVQIAPAITLMAAMFTMTRMARSGEIVPIKSSGISLFRTLAPILAAATWLALATIVVQEMLIPRLATRLLEMQILSVGKRAQYHAVTLLDENGAIVYSERFLPHNDPPQIEEIRIVERYPDPPRTKRRVIKADAGFWDAQAPDLVLSNGMIDEYDQWTGFRKAGHPRFFGPGGARFRTDIRPVDIVYKDQQALLSLRGLADLEREAAKHPGIAPIQVEIASRFTRPLAHLLLLFIGLPFVLGKETKNFFLGAGFAILISGAYYFASLYATKLGYQAHIHPLAAAWSPVILFGSLGAGLLDMVRT